MATALTWLGHASFRLDSPGGKRIYVDPFLSGNPRTPESEQTPERCDLIVVTHGHGDHVGDTIAIHNELGCPDVAVLPIGDHYTMGPQEAAVALELLGVPRCVPSHYGTFPLLTGTPDELRRLAPEVEVLAPEPGETIEL